MSGPIVPPLEVSDEADGGSVSGRPITTIEVTDGDLTISGRTATIDTSGSGGTPGGSDTEVQYNNAGAFGGDSDFTFTGIGGASPTFTITNSASDAGIYTSTRITLDGGTELSVLTTTDGDDGLLLATGADGLGGPFILLDVVTDPSNLLIKNAEENGTINIQTDSGSGDITLTTVGDLRLIASQTLAFTAATTASVTSTTTNNDMNFNIIADGSGTPLINLKNDTKEVRLTCEDDDKLYVRGPTSGERFTFDASSSTGGITFPDSTTLVSAEGTAILSTGETGATKFLREDGDGTSSWQAAGGGGGGFGLTLPYGGDIAATWYNMTATQPGWGGQYMGTVSPGSYGPHYYPFISGYTGDLASITVNVTTAVAASTVDVGIYSDVDGFPAALIGKANIDTSATGHITQTSLSATIAMVKSTQYWIAFAKVDGTGMVVRAVDQAYPAYGPAAVSIGTSLNYTEKNCFYDEFDSTLPATVTTADLLSTARDVPNIGLLW